MDSFITNPPRRGGWFLGTTAHNGVFNENRMDLSQRPRALGENFQAPTVVAPTPTNSYSGPEWSQRSGNTAAPGAAPSTTGYLGDLLKAAAIIGSTTPSSDETTTDAPTVGGVGTFVEGNATISDRNTPYPTTEGPKGDEIIRPPSQATDDYAGAFSSARDSGARSHVVLPYVCAEVLYV